MELRFRLVWGGGAALLTAARALVTSAACAAGRRGADTSGAEHWKNFLKVKICEKIAWLVCEKTTVIVCEITTRLVCEITTENFTFYSFFNIFDMHLSAFYTQNM